MDDLLVNEICADLVSIRVMPGGEDFLAEEETPGSMLLLPSSPFHFLLTLGDCIHHMLPAAAKRPHLQDRSSLTMTGKICYLQHTYLFRIYNLKIYSFFI